MDYCVRRENGVVHGEKLNFGEEGKRGLGWFFYEACKKNANKILQIDGRTGKQQTYSEILTTSIRVAMEMQKMGVVEGDSIAICSTNNMETILPVFAANFINAIISALDPSLSVRDSICLINLVQPKIIFVEPSALNFVEEIIKDINFKMDIIIMGQHGKYLSYDRVLCEKPNENEFTPVILKDINSVANRLFSSGTTGMPKAIECSHYGLLYGMYGLKQLGLNGTATLHYSSFYWISAYVCTMLSAECGGYKVIVSEFNPSSHMKLIQDYKLTYIFMASSTAYSFTKENTAGYDTTSLDDMVFAGSAITDTQMKRVQSFFPNTLISLAYGQTEASNYVTIFTKKASSAMVKKYPGSAGFPIPGISIKIVDPETEETLPPNQQGELRILTAGHFIGYHKEDFSKTFDSNGYIKSGDVAYINDENIIYICDRLKDMFKYKSWHVVPTSVEKVIYQHPAVRETVVLGIPHPEDGDHPMALIVLKEEYCDINEEDILEFVNANVLDREKLRAGVRIVPSIPKTITGKFNRIQIRKAVIQGIL